MLTLMVMIMSCGIMADFLNFLQLSHFLEWTCITNRGNVGFSSYANSDPLVVAAKRQYYKGYETGL